MRRSREILLGAAGLAALVVLVESLPRLGLVDARHLPPSSQILTALMDRARPGGLGEAFGQTVHTWVVGLALAVAAAVVAGVVIGSVPPLRELTASTIEFLRPIPSVALVPLAVLLYGSGRAGTLVLVVYAAFWQVLVQVLAGVRDVDAVARETARCYRLPARWRLRAVLWPALSPHLMTGLRLAATVALVLTVTGELVIGTPGLGAELVSARAGGAVADVYALVLVVGLLGVAVNLGAAALERRLLRWHPAVRQEVPA